MSIPAHAKMTAIKAGAFYEDSLTEQEKVQAFQYALKEKSNALCKALPQHIDAHVFLRNLANAVEAVPQLLRCEPKTLWEAARSAAGVGLLIDSTIGHGYILPYKGKAQFIPGYKGLIELARRSGEIKTLYAYEVCENDQFSYQLGTEPKIDHIPASGTRGDCTHFYAVAVYKNGGFDFEVMSRADIDDIKKRSPSASSSHSPWKSDYAMMARKTVIRRLAKRLPLSAERFHRAVAIEEHFEAGQTASLSDDNKLLLSKIDHEEPEALSQASQSKTSRLDALTQSPSRLEKEIETIKAAAGNEKMLLNIRQRLGNWLAAEASDEERGAIETAFEEAESQ